MSTVFKSLNLWSYAIYVFFAVLVVFSTYFLRNANVSTIKSAPIGKLLREVEFT